MPAAVVAALSTVIVGSITVGQVLLFAASMVLNSTMASRAKKKAEAAQRAAGEAARAEFNSSRVDRTQVIRSGVEPRNMVLGRDEVSGPLWPWITYGPKRNLHAFAIMLAGHECDGIETVLFNHEPVTLDGSGAVIAPDKYVRTVTNTYTERFEEGTPVVPSRTPTRIDAEVVYPFVPGNDMVLSSPGYTALTYTVVEVVPLFRFKFYLGAPGQQASPELIAAAAAAGIPSFWGPSRKATGCTYAVGTMDADFNILGQIGVPNFSFILRGAKAVDRRVGGAATWTQNPAVLSDWLVTQSGFAPATLPAEVNDAELIASANVCDETIALSASSSGPRYLCNGQLTSSASPLDNLNHILDSMDGDAVWVSGQWQIIAGYYKEPTLTIDESSLSSAGIVVNPYTPKRDLFNGLTGTFVNAAAGYTRSGYEMVTNTIYQEEDGGELLPADANFELVNDQIRCQMIAWQRLTRARQPLSAQLGTNLRGYDTAPLQNIEVNLQRLGYVGKVFTNVRRQFDQNKLAYVLQETGPEVWDWDYTKANAVVDLPNTSLPDVATVPVLSGISIATGSVALLRQDAGGSISRARIRWTQVVNTYVADSGFIQWQHKAANDTSDNWTTLPAANGSDTEIFTGALTDGDVMLIRGRCITGQGRQGQWSEIQTVTVLGKTEDPSAPSAVAATPEYTIFTLSPDADVAGYQIRYSPGAVPNASVATALHQGLVAGSPWPMPVRLYGINTIFVRAVDDGGRFSAWASDTQNFGVPDGANIAHLVDYAALGFPGTVTNGALVGAVLEADADPASDIYGAGSGGDIYYRDGAADIYGGSQYLALRYLATYVSPYAGGAIFLDEVSVGSRTTIEYRVDGDPLGDIYTDNDGDGDIYSGTSIYGAEQNWRPWPGVHTPTVAGQGLQFQYTIDAGSTQGELSVFALRTEMPTISQSFGRVVIDAAGTTLLPADGLPALTFIQIEDVQITPIADPSGAISGRVKGEALPSGITVELLNQTPTPVTGPAFVNVSGY